MRFLSRLSLLYIFTSALSIVIFSPRGVASPLISLDRLDCEEAMLGRPQLFGPKAGPRLRRFQQGAILKLALIERDLRSWQAALSQRHAARMERFNEGLRQGFGLNELLAPGPRVFDTAWLKTYFAQLQELSEAIVREAQAAGFAVEVSKQALRTTGELIEPNGAIIMRIDQQGAFDFITPLGQLRFLDQDLTKNQFPFLRILIVKFGLRGVDWPSDVKGEKSKQVYIFERLSPNHRLPSAVRVSPTEARAPYLEQVERWGSVKPAARELKHEPKLVVTETISGSPPAESSIGNAPRVEL